jgi:hypothetical protein
MHSVNQNCHMIRINPGVNAVAKIEHMATALAKTCQHSFDLSANAFR